MDFDFSELWKLLGMGGAGVKAGAQAYGGIAANNAAELAARGADSSGDQAVAMSHLKAQDELKRGRLLASRAQALAAASGAGASDSTVIDIISGIAGEGAYRSELALYEGNEQQRALRAKADAFRYQGKSARAAGFVNAATGMGKTFAGKTFFDKYGGGGITGDSGWETTDYGSGNAYNLYGAGP